MGCIYRDGSVDVVECTLIIGLTTPPGSLISTKYGESNEQSRVIHILDPKMIIRYSIFRITVIV